MTLPISIFILLIVILVLAILGALFIVCHVVSSYSAPYSDLDVWSDTSHPKTTYSSDPWQDNTKF